MALLLGAGCWCWRAFYARQRAGVTRIYPCYNGQMIDHVESHPQVRDRAIFVGEVARLVAGHFRGAEAQTGLSKAALAGNDRGNQLTSVAGQFQDRSMGREHSRGVGLPAAGGRG
jgi:hypothetical protein